AAEYFYAHRAASVSVGDRLVHDLRQVSIFAADVDVSLSRSDREASNYDAFDHRGRVALEDQSVFAGPGFAFVTIAQNVFRFRRLFGNERPLHPGIESCAPASAQAGALNRIDDVIRLHAQGLLHRRVAVQLNISVKIGRTLAKSPGDDLHFVGMGNQISHLI